MQHAPTGANVGGSKRPPGRTEFLFGLFLVGGAFLFFLALFTLYLVKSRPYQDPLFFVGLAAAVVLFSLPLVAVMATRRRSPRARRTASVIALLSFVLLIALDSWVGVILKAQGVYVAFCGTLVMGAGLVASVRELARARSGQGK